MVFSTVLPVDGNSERKNSEIAKGFFWTHGCVDPPQVPNPTAYSLNPPLPPIRLECGGRFHLATNLKELMHAPRPSHLGDSRTGSDPGFGRMLPPNYGMGEERCFADRSKCFAERTRQKETSDFNLPLHKIDTGDA